MADTTAIEQIDLLTLLAQVKPLIGTAQLEANGVVCSDRPREASRWSEMENRLAELRKLKDDWDGLGAKAPSVNFIESALELTQLLSQNGLRSPSRVGAGPDGEILLEWQDSSTYLEAEICKPFFAEWMLVIDGQTPTHWLTVLGSLEQ